jgi:ketosteroid isomerase-like protein
VRSIYADWERGDFSSAEWADPEIEYVYVGGPDAGRSTGVAGMAQGFRDYVRAWEAWRVVAERYVEVDEERVIALFRVSGRGKASGVELGQLRNEGASLFELRDGKVVKIAQYWDRERAFADLGIGQ